MRKKPIRLEKEEEKKPLWDKNHRFVFGVPIEFLLMLIVMCSVFALILLFIGPCTESGNVYNRPLV